jgi:hypothetical protein
MVLYLRSSEILLYIHLVRHHFSDVVDFLKAVQNVNLKGFILRNQKDLVVEKKTLLNVACFLLFGYNAIMSRSFNNSSFVGRIYM